MTAAGDGAGSAPVSDLSHVRRMWDEDRASAQLGMEAVTVEVDHAVVRMTVTGEMVNGHAIAHGGYIFAVADSAFALACNSRGSATVAAGADVVFVADARVRTAYGRSGVTDVSVTREQDGAVIAEFRGRSRTVGPR